MAEVPFRPPVSSANTKEKGPLLAGKEYPTNLAIISRLNDHMKMGKHTTQNGGWRTEGSSSRSTQIISQLVGRISELSQGVDAEQTSFKTTPKTEPTKSTEAEVRRVFGRSCNRQSTTSTTASVPRQPRPPPALPRSQPP